MIWQYSPYYIPFIACGFITLILAVTGWRNRSFVCAKPFTLLMLAAAIWSFGSALEVSAADPITQMFAVTLQYPGSLPFRLRGFSLPLNIPAGSTGSPGITLPSSLRYHA